MLRYQITLRTRRGEQETAARQSHLERLKSWLAAILVLSGIIGVLLAALAIGSVIAAIILILVVVATGAWLVSKLLHRDS